MPDGDAILHKVQLLHRKLENGNSDALSFGGSLVCERIVPEPTTGSIVRRPLLDYWDTLNELDLHREDVLLLMTTIKRLAGTQANVEGVKQITKTEAMEVVSKVIERWPSERKAADHGSSQLDGRIVRQAITELERLRDLAQGVPQEIRCGLFEFDKASPTAENPHPGIAGLGDPLSADEALALIDLGAAATDVTLGTQSPWQHGTATTPAVDRLVILTAPTYLRAKAAAVGRQPAITFSMQLGSWTNATPETAPLIEVLQRGGKVLMHLAGSGWLWSEDAPLADATPEVVWVSMLTDLAARGELLEPYAAPWVYWEVEQACIKSCVVETPPIIASGFDERRRGTTIRSIGLASVEAIDWLIGKLESPPPSPQPAEPLLPEADEALRQAGSNGWSREMSKTEAGRLLGGPDSDKGCRDHLSDLLCGNSEVIQSRTTQKHRFCLDWVHSIEPTAAEKFRPK